MSRTREHTTHTYTHARVPRRNHAHESTHNTHIHARTYAQKISQPSLRCRGEVPPLKWGGEGGGHVCRAWQSRCPCCHAWPHPCEEDQAHHTAAAAVAAAAAAAGIGGSAGGGAGGGAAYSVAEGKGGSPPYPTAAAAAALAAKTGADGVLSRGC